ncbi:thioredoxin family protein [Bacillus carboniphilus]|uniref:Thioredoxin family protein n=1 Tax=Bacillus carboniphilus TaxID=86663 RepID=A0ABY9JXV0_9BACI|nr:thioredoxin family protein [Bacillus carboniphilus]WLR44212.1 thioredoxin family protein [Bacillus carboniphilus]
MKQIQSIQEFEEARNQSLGIFMFTANWCPDCQVIDPILPEIEEENSQYTFYSVNRDNFIDLCVELNIFGIPSFVAFHKGKEIGRFVSKERKTKEQIEEFIQTLKGVSNEDNS